MSRNALVLVVSSVLIAACDPAGGSARCTPGEEACPCARGDRCLTGLACLSGLCVDADGDPGGGWTDTDAGVGGGGDGGGGGGADVPPPATPNPDAFWADDPPPMECRADGTRGTPPATPGGTPECPDDKNREGCRCEAMGESAPCWPGLRANRDRGICQDGVTTCQPFDEFTGVWGPCVGAVLPVEGERLGPQSCRCFSNGRWEIDNLDIDTTIEVELKYRNLPPYVLQALRVDELIERLQIFTIDTAETSP